MMTATATIMYAANRQGIAVKAQNPHFLLTNGRSDYLALGNPNHSNYDGLFIRDGNAYIKVLANIAPAADTAWLEVGKRVVRTSPGAKQEFQLLDDGLHMEGEGKFLLTLDCKRLYDESDRGRAYRLECRDTIAVRKGGLTPAHLITVEYTKCHDDDQSYIAYNIHACIATTMRVQLMGRWREAAYEYDARRGTRNTPWVYDAAALEGEGAVAVAVAQTPAEAQRKAVALLAQRPEIPDEPALPAHALLAWRSLASLQTRTGVMAGLPWFFREWSRDELISLGGLLEAKRYDDVIRSLDKWYGSVRPDGTLPAIHPDEGLASSDAPGWLGKRTGDLLQRLSDENILHEVPQDRIAAWRDASGKLLDACASRIRDGLLQSDANTTWMDTSSNDDGRAGARIEIQALFLALYDAHTKLSTMTKTRVPQPRHEAAQRMVQAVHERLVKDGVLLDGLHADGTPDTLTRPNIFIAWYATPRLFSNEEWRRFFHAALPKLWLEWGGLSSIDRSHPNFHARYTGEDVASYHRGDSWYFVNNMAAIAMSAVAADDFKAPVQKMLQASVDDMLTQGYCGHCSELSEAAGQYACGTHAQAWSASTLIEALLRTGFTPKSEQSQLAQRNS